MKPILIKVSKDKNGSEFVTMSVQEFQAAIDSAYEAGVLDERYKPSTVENQN